MRSKLSALAIVVLASGCSGLEHMDTDELWSAGDSRFNSGQYGEAIPYYAELLNRDEQDTQARILRGVSYERTGESSAALADYAKVGHQGDVRGLLYSANLHIEQGSHGAAEADLGRLKGMGLSGRDRVVQLCLIGTLRLEQRQYMMAAQSLERAIEEGAAFGDATMRGRVRDAQMNAAQCYYHLGDFGRAYDHAVGFAQGGPMSGRDHYTVGLIAYMAGDFTTADEHLAQADPNLVARAAEILDDPSFGAGGGEWNQ